MNDKKNFPIKIVLMIAIFIAIFIFWRLTDNISTKYSVGIVRIINVHLCKENGNEWINVDKLSTDESLSICGYLEAQRESVIEIAVFSTDNTNEMKLHKWIQGKSNSDFVVSFDEKLPPGKYFLEISSGRQYSTVYYFDVLAN